MKNNPSWAQTNEPQTTVTAFAPADDDDDGNGIGLEMRGQ